MTMLGQLALLAALLLGTPCAILAVGVAGYRLTESWQPGLSWWRPTCGALLLTIALAALLWWSWWLIPMVVTP